MPVKGDRRKCSNLGDLSGCLLACFTLSPSASRSNSLESQISNSSQHRVHMKILRCSSMRLPRSSDLVNRVRVTCSDLQGHGMAINFRAAAPQRPAFLAAPIRFYHQVFWCTFQPGCTLCVHFMDYRTSYDFSTMAILAEHRKVPHVSSISSLNLCPHEMPFAVTSISQIDSYSFRRIRITGCVFFRCQTPCK